MAMAKFSLGVVLAALLVFTSNSVQSKDMKKDSIVLTSENVVVLNQEVNGESVSKVIAQVKELDAKLSSSMKEKISGKTPIYLFLNTPGGSIQAGLELIEVLAGIDRPIHTITLYAASMGFQIVQNLGQRYIIRNGVLMSHRAYGGFEGEFGGQSPSQIDSRYALWKERLDEMDRRTVSRTGGKQTLESYQKQYASEMWLTGEQSVKQGYADKVITVKCDATLVGTTHHEFLFMGLIPVSYELDKCPLNTSPMNIKVGFATTRGMMDSDDFVKNGGQFGPSCLALSQGNKDALCALDTSLTMAKVKELKDNFRREFESKQRQVIYMRVQ